jgi:hypothetical protein
VDPSHRGRSQLQMKDVSPGVVQITFPKHEHPYREFALSWLAIATLTVTAFLANKFCLRRIRKHELQAPASFV